MCFGKAGRNFKFVDLRHPVHTVNISIVLRQVTSGTLRFVAYDFEANFVDILIYTHFLFKVNIKILNFIDKQKYIDKSKSDKFGNQIVK